MQLDDEVFLENERQLSAVSEAAEKLAMELQSKEVAFQRQAEDYAALQENLWQAREQIVVLNDSSSKAAFDGIPPSKASLLFRDSVYRSLETKKIALFAALGGSFIHTIHLLVHSGCQWATLNTYAHSMQVLSSSFDMQKALVTVPSLQFWAHVTAKVKDRLGHDAF